jgi:hypothetical protein
MPADQQEIIPLKDERDAARLDDEQRYSHEVHGNAPRSFLVRR